MPLCPTTRKRDTDFIESSLYQKHKEDHQKLRTDTKGGSLGLPSSDFSLNQTSKTCICPNGESLMFLGDHFTNSKGRYMRFKGRLKKCRACPLQKQCMQKPLKEHGRQVSFLIEAASKTSTLDLMKQKIDSPAGKAAYSRRMWTIEPVFANITSNRGLNKLTLRGNR